MFKFNNKHTTSTEYDLISYEYDSVSIEFDSVAFKYDSISIESDSVSYDSVSIEFDYAPSILFGIVGKALMTLLEWTAFSCLSFFL